MQSSQSYNRIALILPVSKKYGGIERCICDIPVEALLQYVVVNLLGLYGGQAQWGTWKRSVHSTHKEDRAAAEAVIEAI